MTDGMTGTNVDELTQETVELARDEGMSLQQAAAIQDREQQLAAQDPDIRRGAWQLSNLFSLGPRLTDEGFDTRTLPANYLSIGPKSFERAHSLTQTAGKILGGPFEKVTQIDETINQLGQGNTIGAATSAAKVLTVTENTPFVPFSENRNLPSSNY